MSEDLLRGIRVRLEALVGDPGADAGGIEDWAAGVMAGDDPLLARAAVWRALEQLSGADLLVAPGRRLHGESDFRAWLAEFTAACPGA